MIRSFIQIEDGPVVDFYEAFGFIYMDADERVAPDEKEDASSNYIEQAGENRDGRTVDAPFDYTAKFLVEAPNQNLSNVNIKINDFNRAVREARSDSDVKRIKKITFYNPYNHVKIVGQPYVVAVPTSVWKIDGDVTSEYAEIELKIRVSEPQKCDFEFKDDNLKSQLKPNTIVGS